ncbi:MAG: hypothetical protein N7Q72_02665, partial [Spiroplasma sp. Tabriz.8]|nr:hypothetical protein [Spiroplasma sp. Tabriz.8]
MGEFMFHATTFKKGKKGKKKKKKEKEKRKKKRDQNPDLREGKTEHFIWSCQEDILLHLLFVPTP